METIKNPRIYKPTKCYVQATYESLLGTAVPAKTIRFPQYFHIYHENLLKSSEYRKFDVEKTRQRSKKVPRAQTTFQTTNHEHASSAYRGRIACAKKYPTQTCDCTCCESIFAPALRLWIPIRAGSKCYNGDLQKCYFHQRYESVRRAEM